MSAAARSTAGTPQRLSRTRAERGPRHSGPIALVSTAAGVIDYDGVRRGSYVGPRPIRVLVADESRAIRLLITSLIRDDDRFTIIGDVATGAEVLERASDSDLVVLDLVLADTDAFSVIQQLVASRPGPAAVIFASVGPDYLRNEAANEGAAAYFTHDTDPVRLLDGLVAAATQRTDPA